MIYLDFFKALVYTAVFSLALTPFDFKLASAVGAIDIPKDKRRMHTRPIPRLGGISIFLSFAFFCLFFCFRIFNQISGFFVGAVIIISLGIIDDSISLSAKSKLFAQICASILAIVGLGRVSIFSGITVILGILWLLTLTNAHNFIDGLDGLCAGISLIEAIAMGILFLLADSRDFGIFAFIAGGACIGFLPYNDNNAKIFMGDTGSAFLGFALAFISWKFMLSVGSVSALISMLLVFSIPICDITFAVTRRIIKGKSPFEPDRSHIHHILADSTLGHKKASLILRIAALYFALTGIVFYFLAKDFL